MTPFEIALAIRNKPDDGEPDTDFVLRTMSGERASDFVTAVDLSEGWERAFDDFAALLDCLKSVERGESGLSISVLIEKKRRLTYDPKLEALLARRWQCPHCKQFASIDRVEVPVGNPGALLRCTTCGEDGMFPVEAKARLKSRDGGKSGLRPT